MSTDNSSEQEAIDVMFENIIEKIQTHPRYGPAIAENAQNKAPFVLNYHSHGPGQPYCVSIATYERKGLPIVGQKQVLKELAHIKGVGANESQCHFLMSKLGSKLQGFCKLDKLPEIYLNGVPLNL
ncbi:MAG: hypothetical protein HY606_04975 [Planctomycetes bacterium]|nr:hypothetical protein [Planctomycetota bacterium]